eukprot:773584-Ditylum_brightwellii.AAC.1
MMQREYRYLKYFYAYLDLLDTDKTYLKDGWGFADIKKIYNLSKEEYETMEDPNATNTRRSLVRQLKYMVVWVRFYKKGNDELPKTVEDWKVEFNKDIFNDVENERITMKNEVKEE